MSGTENVWILVLDLRGTEYLEVVGTTAYKHLIFFQNV